MKIRNVAQAVNSLLPAALKESFNRKLVAMIRTELQSNLKMELIESIRAELEPEIRTRLKEQLIAELKPELDDLAYTVFDLFDRVQVFCAEVQANKSAENFDLKAQSLRLRHLVRASAGLSPSSFENADTEDLLAEFRFLRLAASVLKPAFRALTSQRVLFCGQAYYNAWYLSRELRNLGWSADVYNWDSNRTNDIYYHGEDFRLGADVSMSLSGELGFYLSSLYEYDIIHFSNVYGMAYGWNLQGTISQNFEKYAEIYLLKALGKVVVYSNNGCLDGVSQSEFAKWGPESVCSICRWQNEPAVCSDERNLAWGIFRNSVADFQCLLGGNRADYNDDPRVHEVPEFYCLDPELWHPHLTIPREYQLPELKDGGVRLYHAVGHRDDRTFADGVNIKSSHVYLPLIERLRDEGISLELVSPTGVPNKDVRYLQAQSDIFLEMLTYGWFGANAREAMMLGKPVICFIRPEWLKSLSLELPDYAAELPIISATPDSVEAILRDLIHNPDKRLEIGQRSRKFALKWHSATSAGKRFDRIYSRLLAGDPLLQMNEG